MQLMVYLLGAPRVERDGEPLELTTRKALALLAYLAVTGTSHSRDALAALFWPESGQSHARGALRYTLAMLKSTLGEEWLLATREQIGLAQRRELEVDVLRFDRLITEWKAHGHAPEEACPDCVPLLDEAVALQRGPFLAGFTLPDSPAFDDWQFFETERLQRAQAAALAALVAYHRARSASAAAIPYAQRWLALDPLQEEVQRLLMQLYAAAGQRGAALRQYAACRQLLQDEMGVEPAPETTALYEQIRTAATEAPALAAPAVAAAARPTARAALPVPATPLVGRGHEVAALQTLLDDPTRRLVTLLGPGGSGKTRLALAVAEARQAAYAHGVAFVSLAPLSAPDALVATIAAALDYTPPAGGDLQRHLIDYLRQKELLLVLDNLEHLLDRTGDGSDTTLTLLEAILGSAPGVQTLVTSRERLQLYEEQLYLVQGLPYPEWEVPEDAATYPAVQLFVQRARQVQPDFALTPATTPAVTRIVRLVAGQPLAIELAAAWVGVLAPDEVAAEIAQRLDLLATEVRNVPARHRSMRAVYEVSWRRLSSEEQELLQALAVFRGGFTRAAASEVAAATPQQLQALVDQSLLGRDARTGGTGRFDLHELLRQYAAEHLQRDPATRMAVATRHAAYYARFLSERAADLKGSRQQAALQEIEADLENARAAWEWAVAEKAVALIGQALDTLCGFFERRGRYQEGAAACQAVVERLAGALPGGADGLILGQALAWQGVFYASLGQLAQARALLEQSLPLLQTPAAATARAFALLHLGRVALANDRAAALRCYEQSLALYQAQGDRWGEASALAGLGELAWTAGDYASARQRQQDSLDLYRALGDQIGIAHALQDLARIAHFQGQIADAERLLQESSMIWRNLGDQASLAQTLNNLGAGLLFAGQYAEAQRLLQESLAIYHDLGTRPNIASVSLLLGIVHIALGMYDEAAGLGEASLALVRYSGNQPGIGMALCLMGWAALAREEYSAAQRFLHESLAVYEAIRQPEDLVMVLCLLSHTSRALGNHDAAQQHAETALRTAAETRGYRASLVALGALAAILAGRGEVEQAVELQALVARYPIVANSVFWRDRVGGYITTMAAALPPEVVAAARARGPARDLQATVAELAAEYSAHPR